MLSLDIHPLTPEIAMTVLLITNSFRRNASLSPNIRTVQPGGTEGVTVFRIPGPNEVDYGVESREIRNALTDSCYVGQGREGSMDIYLIGKGAFEMVFLEDNQATI